MTVNFPKTLAAAQASESSQWAIGDGLVKDKTDEGSASKASGFPENPLARSCGRDHRTQTHQKGQVCPL